MSGNNIVLPFSKLYGVIDSESIFKILQMKKVNFLIIYFSFLVSSIHSQITTFEKTFDYGHAEEGQGIVQTKYEGYFIGGPQWFSSCYASLLAVKTDSLGNEQWHRLDHFACLDVLHDVVLADDGNFVGIGEAGNNGTTNIVLVKYSQNGEIIWVKFYQSPSYGFGNAVSKTNDGGFILAGAAGGMNLYADAYIIRTDSSGNELWSKSFGSGSIENALDVIQTTDGGFAVTGYQDGIYPNTTVENAFLWKVSSQGDSLWLKNYGNETTPSRGYGLVELSNGNIIIGGDIAGGGPYWGIYTVLVDSLGNVIKEKKSIGPDNQYCAGINKDLSGNKIMVVGETYNYNTQGKQDLYLLALTPDLDSLWQRLYGGPDSDSGNDIIPTSDGGFAIVGYTGINVDLYLIKTDSMGCVIPGCNISATNPPPQSPDHGISIFPNPTNTTCTIECWLPVSQSVWISCYDVTGRRVFRQALARLPAGLQDIPLDMRDFPIGLYVVQIQGDEGVDYMAKVIRF